MASSKGQRMIELLEMIETAAAEVETAAPKDEAWTGFRSAAAARRWAATQTLAMLRKAVADLKNRYYNNPDAKQVSDAVYDAVEEALIAKSPNGQADIALQSGAPVLSRSKRKLPVFMGSQPKIKSGADVSAFVTRTKSKLRASTYIFSAKLDGVSALYENIKGAYVLSTKGDGVTGKDISGLVPSMRLPKIRDGVKVRGEMIIDETKFAAWKGARASGKFTNARAMVSGVTNRTDVHAGMGDVDFVAFELIGGGTPEQQFKALKALGFKVAPWVKVKDPDEATLTKHLQDFQRIKYDIDGGVLIVNAAYTPATSTYPDYSAAFKPDRKTSTTGFSLDTQKQVRVLEVVWRETRTGEIRPRVNIEPTELDGVTVNFASGHNAALIQQNGIGPGAIVTIVRSGKVIPYVTGVVKRAKPQMPSIPYEVRGKQAYAIEASGEVELRHAEHFFVTCGIEGFKYSSIVKMMNAGFDLEGILCDATEADFVAALGKNGLGVYDQMEALYDDPLPLATLLDASGYFKGIGSTQFFKLTSAIPDLLTARKSDVLERMKTIDGWGSIMISVFSEGFRDFLAFMRRTNLKAGKVKAAPKPKTQRLAGQVVLFSKVRDKAVQAAITENGGVVTESYSKTVTHLICPAGESSSKIDRARAAGVEENTLDGYRKKYRV